MDDRFIIRKLADGVVLAVARLSDCQQQLLPAEETLSHNATPARVRELRGGRALARHALHALGMRGSEPILSGAEGEPLWPAGFCGSLSHTATHVSAIVADNAKHLSVGVDVNDARPLGPHLDAHVANSGEREILLNLSCATTRADVGNIAFSVKEAFFKAQFCLTRLRHLGFSEVCINVGVRCGELAFSCPAVEHALASQVAFNPVSYVGEVTGQLVCWVIWPA